MNSAARGFVFLVMLFMAPGAMARPDSLWSVTLDWGVPSAINGALEMSDGSIVLVGSIDSSTAQSSALVARITRAGQLVWNRGHMLEPEGLSAATAAVELAGGLISVSGWSRSPIGFLFGTFSGAGSLNQTWDYHWTSGQTKSYGMALRSDNNVAAVGYLWDPVEGHSDAILVVKRASGDTLFTRVFGGDDTDVGHGILANADGSMVTCASTKSSGAGSNDFLLTKFDAAGSPLWSFTYGDTASNSCFGLARGPNGGYYLAGGTQFTSGAADPLVMRVDSGGNLRWLRTDYASGNAQVRGISGRGATGALAAGFLADAPERCWLLGIDSSGEALWDWSWGIGASGLNGVIELRCGSHLAFGYTTVNAHLCGYAMFLTPDQGIYGTVRDSEDDTPLAGVTVRALGETCVSQTTSVGRFALALDAGIYDLEFSGPCLSTDTLFGLEVWADSVRTVEIPARRPRLTEWPTSVNILAHNRVQAAGQLVLHNAGVGDLSFALNVRQSRPAGTWLSFIPATGIVPANSSFSVQALVQADTTDDRIYDFSAVVDLRTNSCPDSVLSIPVFVTVLEVDEPPSVPRELTMSALFPNPFNAVAEFAISLPMGGLVDIGVYDITGRRAAVLQHGDLAPGSHEIRFDGSALSTGIYFVELRMGSQRLLQKAVLLK